MENFLEVPVSLWLNGSLIVGQRPVEGRLMVRLHGLTEPPTTPSAAPAEIEVELLTNNEALLASVEEAEDAKIVFSNIPYWIRRTADGRFRGSRFGRPPES